jgi:hypothetical protein
VRLRGSSCSVVESDCRSRSLPSSTLTARAGCAGRLPWPATVGDRQEARRRRRRRRRRDGGRGRSGAPPQGARRGQGQGRGRSGARRLARRATARPPPAAAPAAPPAAGPTRYRGVHAVQRGGVAHRPLTLPAGPDAALRLQRAAHTAPLRPKHSHSYIHPL